MPNVARLTTSGLPGVATCSYLGRASGRVVMQRCGGVIEALRSHVHRGVAGTRGYELP